MHRSYSLSQKGMILLTSLLFLLMLTAVAVTSVNYSNLSPRKLANAELKTLTFNQAQGELNEVNALGMDQLTPNQCPGESPKNTYNPTEAPAGSTSAEIQNHRCNTASDTSANYLTTTANTPRKEDASGVGNYSVEYYRLEAEREQSGIRTSIAMNSYKGLLGDQSGSTFGLDEGRTVTIGDNFQSN
ncbi:hypothetical protein [Endozoicomonas sp. ALD040]|uniref:hypothetical protein n=1 Tax=Endozoicomonas sp. ALD040 TaxID=3403079 RepID=UPI003BAEC669